MQTPENEMTFALAQYPAACYASPVSTKPTMRRRDYARQLNPVSPARCDSRLGAPAPSMILRSHTGPAPFQDLYPAGSSLLGDLESLQRPARTWAFQRPSKPAPTPGGESRRSGYRVFPGTWGQAPFTHLYTRAAGLPARAGESKTAALLRWRTRHPSTARVRWPSFPVVAAISTDQPQKEAPCPKN